MRDMKNNIIDAAIDLLARYDTSNTATRLSRLIYVIVYPFVVLAVAIFFISYFAIETVKFVLLCVGCVTYDLFSFINNGATPCRDWVKQKASSNCDMPERDDFDYQP